MRRVLGRYTSAGVCIAIASCGRTWLNSTRHSSHASCCANAVRRLLLEIDADVGVHSLVRTIVLRAAGPTANDVDTQRDPPRRQLRQAGEAATRGERGAVVALDCLRQTVPLEQLFEDSANSVGVGARQDAQREDETAEGISHRQRLTAAAIARRPPALEVDGPEVIRCLDDDMLARGLQ